MGDERKQTEIRTDEELADQRHLRFGRLPARVSPDDLVETEEAHGMHEDPAEPMVRREWG